MAHSLFGRTYEDFRGGAAPSALAMALSGIDRLPAQAAPVPYTGLPSGIHAGPQLPQQSQGPSGPQSVVGQRAARAPSGSGGGRANTGALGAGLRSAGASIAAGLEASRVKDEQAAEAKAMAKAKEETSQTPLPWPSTSNTESGASQGGTISSTPGGPPIFTRPGHGASPVANYIRESATKHGIDPNIAVRVAQSEGLRGYVGDQGSSFGPFQLHYGGVAGGSNRVGGLGDVFTRQTGLDARDRSTVRDQIDFSLRQAAKGGWGPWHGARAVGIGNWEGIRGRQARLSDKFGLGGDGFE